MEESLVSYRMYPRWHNRCELHTAEHRASQVEMAKEELKLYKSPGTDQTPAYCFAMSVFHKLFNAGLSQTG